MLNPPSGPFQSFFQGGFECSTHRRRDGRRLDLIAATQHDRFALEDYTALRKLGVATVRDGLRWHLIETREGVYDFSSVMPLLRAAQATGMQVIWDICHYGWPDDVDVFTPAFPRRLGGLAKAFARLLRDETDSEAFLTPFNEPSFISWSGGDVEYLNPFAKGRGADFKSQIVLAVIEASAAIRDVLPTARLVQCEPAIHITADPLRPEDRAAAEGYRLSQFEFLDMLAGRIFPELGGNAKYLDIIGVNYYWNNQWIHNGPTLLRTDPLYRPFRRILAEFYTRYQRPIFVSETGIEDLERPAWFRYVASEVRAACLAGVPVEGICLYPIVNHPGWDDDRHCYNGLFDYPNPDGRREVYQPLAVELKQQQQLFAS